MPSRAHYEPAGRPAGAHRNRVWGRGRRRSACPSPPVRRRRIRRHRRRSRPMPRGHDLQDASHGEDREKGVGSLFRPVHGFRFRGRAQGRRARSRPRSRAIPCVHRSVPKERLRARQRRTASSAPCVWTAFTRPRQSAGRATGQALSRPCSWGPADSRRPCRQRACRPADSADETPPRHRRMAVSWACAPSIRPGPQCQAKTTPDPFSSQGLDIALVSAVSCALLGALMGLRAAFRELRCAAPPATPRRPLRPMGTARHLRRRTRQRGYRSLGHARYPIALRPS